MRIAAILFLLIHIQEVVASASGPKVTRRMQQVETKRKCELDADAEESEEIKFKCKSTTEDSVSELKDTIMFKVSSEDSGALKVKVEYEQEAETEESETETETQYEVVFESLVEYKYLSYSLSKTDAYDWDTTSVVKETPLTMGPLSSIATTDSSYVFSASSTDGTALFTFTIFRGGDNELVTANKMKIDFELRGYEWTDTDTNVALISRIESQREVEIEYEDEDENSEDAPEVAIKSGPGSKKAEEVKISFSEALQTIGVNVFGEYTWANEATVRSLNETDTIEEGIAIEVIATSPADGSDAVAFSFVGEAARMASDIYWDPEVGVNFSSGVTVANTLSALAVIAGVTIVLLF